MQWVAAGGLQSGLAYPGGGGELSSGMGRHVPGDASGGTYREWGAPQLPPPPEMDGDEFFGAGWGTSGSAPQHVSGRADATTPTKPGFARRAVTALRQQQLNAALMKNAPATYSTLGEYMRDSGVTGRAGQAEPPWRR